MQNNRRTSAFSLIELSIVILIIGILIAGITQSSRLVGQMRLASARSLTQSSPVPSIQDLSAWFESTSTQSFIESQADEGNAITTWRDINPTSANKLVLTHLNVDPNTAENLNTYPTYSSHEINNLPAVKFNGSLSYLDSLYSQDINPSTFTIFTVTRIPKLSTYFGAILSSRGSTTGYILYSTGDDTQKPNSIHLWTGATSTWNYSNPAVPLNFDNPQLYSVTFDGSKVTAYDAGAIIGPVNSSLVVNDSKNLRVGAGANESAQPEYYLNGSIGEIIIFERSLKREERQSVEQYLGKKWGIKLKSTTS